MLSGDLAFFTSGLGSGIGTPPGIIGLGSLEPCVDRYFKQFRDGGGGGGGAMRR